MHLDVHVFTNCLLIYAVHICGVFTQKHNLLSSSNYVLKCVRYLLPFLAKAHVNGV